MKLTNRTLSVTRKPLLFYYHSMGALEHCCNKSQDFSSLQSLHMTPPVDNQSQRKVNESVDEVEEQENGHSMMPNARKLIKYDRNKLLKLLGLHNTTQRQVCSNYGEHWQSNRRHNDRSRSEQASMIRQQQLQLKDLSKKIYLLDKAQNQGLLRSVDSSEVVNPEKVYLKIGEEPEPEQGGSQLS